MFVGSVGALRGKHLLKKMRMIGDCADEILIDVNDGTPLCVITHGQYIKIRHTS